MAMLSIKLPEGPARALSGIDVPGKKTPLDEFHITLMYMEGDLPTAELAKALGPTLEVVSATTPFTVQVERVATFSYNDDGTPVMCPVISKDLHDLRARLADAWDRADVPYSKKYPEYKPHVTLSYAEEDITLAYALPSPVEWEVREVALWSGDSEESAIVAAFPILTRSTLASRVLKRFARAVGVL